MAAVMWHDRNIVYPLATIADSPNADLGHDIIRDYEEAQLIVGRSPRGSAALLRLGIPKLCRQLGQPGKNINDDIKQLVANGLSKEVQRALDSVRVIGNEAVHPGELNIKDDHETAYKLFRLLNFVAQKMLTEPREIEESYNGLPPDKLAAIERRDA